MKSLIPDTLTPAQAQVVSALAQGATITDAAGSAGLHRSTIYNWLENQPNFQTAVEQARAEYAAALCDDLQALRRDALATLRSLLDDPETPRTLRFRVAMAILQRPQSPEHDWNLPEPVGNAVEPQLRAGIDVSDECADVSNVSNVLNVPDDSKESNVSKASNVSKSLTLPPPRNTPRNHPCPCGSGRKYKKCCYLEERPPQSLAA